ncbi:hypothetical protein AWB76_07783 [Caballeronia temeraria]|uniref:Uncharacterized protein n=1 Tax=Caballeronia temeraria TaxID=1777137 RepID=A0A158DZY6_9BURK|nr:hypothetical protein AWB76_07783 [Caballeronia temeraria]
MRNLRRTRSRPDKLELARPTATPRDGHQAHRFRLPVRPIPIVLHQALENLRSFIRSKNQHRAWMRTRARKHSAVCPKICDVELRRPFLMRRRFCSIQRIRSGRKDVPNGRMPRAPVGGKNGVSSQRFTYSAIEPSAMETRFPDTQVPVANYRPFSISMFLFYVATDWAVPSAAHSSWFFQWKVFPTTYGQLRRLREREKQWTRCTQCLGQRFASGPGAAAALANAPMPEDSSYDGTASGRSHQGREMDGFEESRLIYSRRCPTWRAGSVLWGGCCVGLLSVCAR